MIQIKENIHDMLSKEVNRREFLMHTAAAGVALLGINELIKNLTDPHQIKVRRVIQGYGNSIYGR